MLQVSYSTQVFTLINLGESKTIVGFEAGR